LRNELLVGLAGFEPTTFTRKRVFAQFLRVSPDRSRTSSSHVLVRKPVSNALEPVVIPA